MLGFEVWLCWWGVGERKDVPLLPQQTAALFPKGLWDLLMESSLAIGARGPGDASLRPHLGLRRVTSSSRGDSGDLDRGTGGQGDREKVSEVSAVSPVPGCSVRSCASGSSFPNEQMGLF